MYDNHTTASVRIENDLKMFIGKKAEVIAIEKAGRVVDRKFYFAWDSGELYLGNAMKKLNRYGGSNDCLTKDEAIELVRLETERHLAEKQDKLTPGNHIIIDENNEISVDSSGLIGEDEVREIVEDATEGKADSSYVDSVKTELESSIGTKATQTDLNNAVTGIETEISTLSANLSAQINNKASVESVNAISEELNNKVDNSEFEILESTVNTKASQNDLLSVELRVGNTESSITNLNNSKADESSVATRLAGKVNNSDFQTLSTLVNINKTDADTKFENLDSNIDSIENSVTSLAQTVSTEDSKLQTQVNTINSKIPNAATSTNKLADQSFVNSSIATNTANFKGTNTTATTQVEFLKWCDEELENVTNNDYVFWSHNDSGNIKFDRYKFNGSTWEYEYTLNNSSFTAEQWESISSGISEEKINSYDSHIANNDIHISRTEFTTSLLSKQDLLSVDTNSSHTGIILTNNVIGIDHGIIATVDALSEKSTVTASATGTSTNKIKYLTIDSTEYAVGGDEYPVYYDGSSSKKNLFVGYNKSNTTNCVYVGSAPQSISGSSYIYNLGNENYIYGEESCVFGRYNSVRWGSISIGLNNSGSSNITDTETITIGRGLKAHNQQKIIGRYNIEDWYDVHRFIIADGSATSVTKNLFTVGTNGKVYASGDVYANCSDYTTTSSGPTTANCGGKKLATEEYVDTLVGDIESILDIIIGEH